MAVRLAVWSGPRNLSTALMRAWENRPDTVVWDEPLYAAYLYATGVGHPGRERVIAAGIRDRDEALRACCDGPAPDGAAVFYQKHMAHHLPEGFDYARLDPLRNALLIRDPRAVLRSYTETRAEVVLADIGLPQQLAAYRALSARRSQTPPVIDAADFLADPRGYLDALCDYAGVAFDERMLSWPPGPRASDGVWGKYWYASVWRSTGFAAPRPHPQAALPAPLEALAEQARPYYDALYAVRLRL